MTLEEKAAFLSGMNTWQTRNYERLEIPSIFLADGPHGVRKQVGSADHLGLNASIPATCFPPAATLANSWDDELIEEVGKVIGEEAAALEVDILLGPGLNIKRSPVCGRNFEYYSEDPYLSGKMAAAFIRGVQSKGVSACPKHFAVNNQELRRMSMNAVIDERTLREIYLTGFEIAVIEGKADTIMTSYNQVNGTYANENEHLLKDILRGDWGFEGVVVTDWGGSNDHVAGVKATSTLEMPSPGLDSARELLAAVKNGQLREEVIDERVAELLDLIITKKELKQRQSGKSDKSNNKNSFDIEMHHQMARKAAENSGVLLKNQNNILPLKSKQRVALIGDFAFSPRYQGAGSSIVNTTILDTMKQVISEYDLDVVGTAKGYIRNGESEDNSCGKKSSAKKSSNGNVFAEELKRQAVALAKEAEVVIYCFGLDELSESEGMDRTHLKIRQNQIDLLQALYQENKNIVGVISAGSVIEMPWEKYLKGILHTYLGGQAGAKAVFNILTGKVNPSGRLNESYPMKYEDTPAYEYCPGKERNSEYRESIFVGYRYYDTSNISVRYPFGYGLSYTDYSYKNLVVAPEGIRVTITNTGAYDGHEVVQMYIGKKESGIFRAAKELKGFSKIYLKSGESKEVFIKFDDKSFRYWNTATNKWETEAGVYQIYVGANSRDILLSDEITISGSSDVMPYDKADLSSYYTGNIKSVDNHQYQKLLGIPIPDGSWSGKLNENDAICQMYYARSGLARFVYRRLKSMLKKSERRGKPNLNIIFIFNMPFRGIAKMTNGMVSKEMTDGMIKIVNGKFLKGLAQVIGGYFRNRKQNKEYEKIL